MTTVPIYQIDSFTDAPFRGNPAAVCLLEKPADPVWMQNVALEMNLSETAFVTPEPEGFNLRWFTPTVEMDLCGHATLAAAHALWESGTVPAADPCRFHTRSGLLTTEQRDGWIRMEFPMETYRPEEVEDSVAKALGVKPIRSVLSERLDILLIEVETEAEVRDISPDFSSLATCDRHAYIVTSKAKPGDFDFISRFFAPGFGIDEDPVTGGAHCVLARYWQERLEKSAFLACQASARGGIIKVEAADPRCFLSGQAVTVLRGDVLGP